MRIIIISIVLILQLDLHSQEYEWIRAEEINYEFNPGMLNYVVEATDENTVWYAGMLEFIEFYQEAMGDIFLNEYDAQGNKLHEFVIVGSALVTDLAAGSDGYIYLAGQYRSDLLFPGGYLMEFLGPSINSFLARISASGQTDWVIDLDEDFPNAVIDDILLMDEQILVAHSEWLESNISRYDLDGNLIGSIQQLDVGIVSSVAKDSDGNIYATGSCAGGNSLFGGIAFTSPFNYNMYLVKYSEDGNPEWVQFVEDITCMEPRILCTDAGQVTWTGALNLQTYFDTIALQGPSWVYDLFVTRYTSDGHILWGFEVPQVTTGDASVNKHSNSTFLPDGMLVLGGFTRGSVDWGNGIISDAGGFGSDLMALAIEDSGAPAWVKTGGGEGHSTAMAIASAPDGSIYQAGIGHGTINFDTCSFTGESYYYPFLVKIAPAFPASVPKTVNKQGSLHLYPNPVSDQLKVLLTGDDISQVRIFDSQGNLIRAAEGQTDFNLSEYPEGVYFLEAESDRHRKYSARFIKVR